MQDSKNLILAIALSLAVLLGWQYYFGTPMVDQQMKLAQQAAQSPNGTPNVTGQAGVVVPGQATATSFASRDEAIAAGPRIKIDTPKLSGSIALTGGDIDDISLKTYRETVNPSSANIVLLSPNGSPNA